MKDQNINRSFSVAATLWIPFKKASAHIFLNPLEAAEIKNVFAIVSVFVMSQN